MATVYLATDLRLDRRVAIKIMHGHLADDGAFTSRFVQEARSAARLAHPNVVNVFDQGQDGDATYLVMEYLPGITLRDLLKEFTRLTPAQTIEILHPILSGLAAAHDAGIVHRDIKPENVLLADDGRIKIGDFGLARASSANTTTGQALLGTIAYLSPELLTRGVADARSDIYAIGIMMFEMLTGAQPFHGERPIQIAYQHTNDNVPLPSSIEKDIPPELDELVLWATEKDPASRPSNARELLARLSEVEAAIGTGSAIQTQLTVPMTIGSSAEHTRVLDEVVPSTTIVAEPSATAKLSAATKRRSRKGWFLVMLTVALSALGGGTGWYFGAGPGGLVTVPHLAGSSVTSATRALVNLGFVARTGQEFSISVPEGIIVRSTPAAGKAIARGSKVTMMISQGPRPITLPQLAGAQTDAAKNSITAAGAVVGTIDHQFSAKVPSGVVIQATRASDGSDISNGGAYFQAAKVNLAVSVGAVPDVSGKSVSDATAVLKQVNLTAVTGSQDYSPTVPSGSVIQVQFASEPVRPGATVTLDVSKGPAPVPVPNVVGETWDTAKKTLSGAGFQLNYNALADLAPGAFTVSKVTPSAGTVAPFGSSVTVNFQGF